MLDFIVTVYFIWEEWLSLFKLLNSGLSSEFCSDMFLKIDKSKIARFCWLD